MPDLPLVSIITPSYNQDQFLEATIRSVLEQDYARIEYIIIDGDSKDNSRAIIERYADRLAYWESLSDRGQAHAINKGLQRAHGDILGWLNSDDILLPGVVSRIVEDFGQFPDVDVIYGRLERIDEHGTILPTPTLPKDRVDFGLDQVLSECVVNQPGSFWRRSAMEKVGWLDEKLRYSLDYDYWIRMALAGARFRHLPIPVAQFRLSRASKTVGQTAAFAQEQLGVLETLFGRPDLPSRLGWTAKEVRRQMLRTRASIRLNVCYGQLKLHRYNMAARWLVKALRDDPFVVFQRRWLDLAIARLAARRTRGLQNKFQEN